MGTAWEEAPDEALLESARREPAAFGAFYTGFARADVLKVEPVEKSNDTTVILSPPWRPVPWDREPIRFLLVYDRVPPEQSPRDMTYPSLRVRLADGRTVLVP